MYSEYSTIPMNRHQSSSNYSSSISNMPVSSSYYTNDGDRIIGGGFAFPFLLGGVTGAALAPSFWRPGYGPGFGPRPYPPYYPPYYPPRPYPYYRPY